LLQRRLYATQVAGKRAESKLQLAAQDAKVYLFCAAFQVYFNLLYNTSILQLSNIFSVTFVFSTHQFLE